MLTAHAHLISALVLTVNVEINNVQAVKELKRCSIQKNNIMKTFKESKTMKVNKLSNIESIKMKMRKLQEKKCFLVEKL